MTKVFFKYLTRKSNLMVILLTLICWGSVSCGDDDPPTTPPSSTPPSSTTEPTTPDNPGTEPKTASISVNKTSLVFEGEFGALKSGIDYKQTVDITSSGLWTATISSDAGDWLTISPSNGTGNAQMDIYPKTSNDKSTERMATITLVCSNASTTINITQSAGKPVCYAEPINHVALWNQLCWEYSATSNVNTFQVLCLSENEYKRMTDLEIIAELNQQEVLKFVDDYISFRSKDSHNNDITSNTTYYICTIATDENGKLGELKKTSIKTPSYKNADDDAWVSFSNQAYGSSGFQFDVTKEGYSNSYHLIYGHISSDMKYPSSLYAFEINYYLKYGKKHWFSQSWDLEIVTNYPNNHTFTYTTSTLSYYPLIVAYGWGVFQDGSPSSDMQGFRWDTSSSNSSQIKVRRGSDEHIGNMTIRRSEVERESAKHK